MKPLHFIIIAVVVFLGIGAWQYPKMFGSPQDLKQAEELKTYDSQAHGFSFSYPLDWDMRVVSDTDSFLSISLSKKDETQGKIDVYGEMMLPSYSISVTVSKSDGNLSARDMYLGNFTLSSQKEAEQNFKTIQVGEIEGIEYQEGAAPSSGPSTGVLVVRNSKAYRFIYSALAHKETHEKYIGVFQNMVGSVKWN